MRFSTSDTSTLRAKLTEKARALGFDAIGFTPAETGAQTAARLAQFVDAERHGTMDWMRETLERRAHPRSLWPEARTAIVVALNYGPEDDPLATTRRPEAGTVSVYARGRDYHDIVKGRLKELAQAVVKLTDGAEVKVFVDTAPLMEKPLAMSAGIGWQGKHTNLVSRSFGSWLFLGVVLSAAEIAPDTPTGDVCGSCRACLDACPTGAFPAPYQIDARRCVSYLTIEHKGHIDADLRPGIGNRIYGCDDCLAVCPWNKFAQSGREAKLKARDDLAAPALDDLAGLDDAGFRALFSGSPIKRVGRDRFVRNVMIAIGNSGAQALLARALEGLDDASPLVRAMAVWACRRLMDEAGFAVLAADRSGCETDADVCAEWRAPASKAGAA